MKISKTILILFITILIVPIFSIVVLSFQDNDNERFRWYIEILGNSSFLSSLGLSFLISSIVALLSTTISFLTALSWFNAKQRFLVFFVIIIFGLLPPDILALSISKIPRFLGLYDLNLLFLCFGLLLYCLPFGVLIFWTRFYFIDDIILKSAKDIGFFNSSIIFKIIAPLSSMALVSCFMFSFLLSFNEYPRTYYLSGFYMLVSEFLNGKLSSGADQSIYAGGSLIILLTSISTVLLGVAYLISKRKTTMAE